MNPIMTITPIKSIKNAPTIGTTKYALGEFPYYLVITSKFAMAFGVAPSPCPIKPPTITAAS